MRGRLAILLAVATFAGPAAAELPAQCQVAQHLNEYIFPLPAVARAIAAKKLEVLVIGAGSSMLPGPNGASFAYPARLEAALGESLPGVAVKVATDIASRRTAAEMVSGLPAALSASKPQLLVWQTGTIDAMQGVDPDQFKQTLDQGINLARGERADVVLVNAQYSPRTESIIALGTYADDMRWVALQHDVPLFNRFGIMRLWADLGTFDFTTATKKLDMAKRVHDCIGRLLADLIVESARSGAPHSAGDR